MAIIKQYDKRSGITYAYEATYYWDKEKQQSRSKRKLIGRVDAKTGEIVPTDGQGRKKKALKSPNDSKNEKKTKVELSTFAKRKFCGATYLLDSFAEEIGLVKDLETCFPETYKQILSVAYYHILEDNSPLYRFEKWNCTHKHPFAQDIASARSSELFASISDQQVNQFFQLQSKRRVDDEYWAYDSTSISSYSEMLSHVKYGKNKENDKLPQLNLLLVFGEKSGLPFYYRKVAGNIPDSKTVKRLLEEFKELGIDNAKFVMDRGFYSQENIDGMYKNNIGFLLGAKLSLAYVKKNLSEVHENIRFASNFNSELNIFGYTVKQTWNTKKKNES